MCTRCSTRIACKPSIAMAFGATFQIILFSGFVCFIPLSSFLRFQFFCLSWGKVLFFCVFTTALGLDIFCSVFFTPLLNVRCALSVLYDNLNNYLRYYKNLFKREDHSKWYLRNEFFCKRKSNNTNLNTCNL